MVVARRKSGSGAGLIASDPHVGLMLPNLWLIGGWKSPTYHTVGLMFPGLPVMALGRNEHIAWGGTNMHAASSDLFDIGEMAHHGPEDLFIALMTFAGAFGIMWTVDWQLALITFSAVPILVVLIAYFNVKLNKAAKMMFENIADVNARVEDSVSGIRVVKSFGNEPFEIERFELFTGINHDHLLVLGTPRTS